MPIVKVLTLVASFATLVACGGSVVNLGPGDGGSGGDGPNPSCPMASTVDNGVLCSDPGLSCPGAFSQPTCDGEGAPVQCTCGSSEPGRGATWQCAEFSGGISCPPPPPPPSCPAPSYVTQGAACSTEPQLSCQSDIAISGCNGQPSGFVDCSCLNGSWSCAQAGGPACIIDAGAPCPNPNSTFAGQGCATYGMNCGGDPQTCGGGVVYDALQCVGGVWEVAVGTTCDVDAGFSDAQGPDF